jgi:rSAM/selenodomain-associated transferase 2
VQNTKGKTLSLSHSISVVIPAINEADGIRAAIDSAFHAGAHQVVVADGGSHDRTLEVARAAGTETVMSAAGRAIQQNAGAAICTGEVLLFLHADCRLAKDCLEQVAVRFERHLSQPRRGMTTFWGGFRQRIDERRTAYRFLEFGNNMRVRWGRLVYGDQGLFVTRTCFEKVNGFAPIPLMEDVALSRKLSRISAPQLLSGPITVSPRRWQKRGIIRQTLRNWVLLARYFAGASPSDLAAAYHRHDQV